MDTNIILPSYSLGCTLIIVGWVMDCWLFNGIHLTWSGVFAILDKNLLRHNNPKNIILCCSKPLNTCEWLICQIYE